VAAETEGDLGQNDWPATQAEGEAGNEAPHLLGFGQGGHEFENGLRLLASPGAEDLTWYRLPLSPVRVTPKVDRDDVNLLHVPRFGDNRHAVIVA
jgi:hypothetical protein